MLQTPLERVIGAKFRTFAIPADQADLARLFETGQHTSNFGEICIRPIDGKCVPSRPGAGLAMRLS